MVSHLLCGVWGRFFFTLLLWSCFYTSSSCCNNCVLFDISWCSLSITSVGYTWKNVEEMKQVLKDVRQPVTFPVRAYLVGRSKEQLLWLLKQKKNYSLTIWHSYVDKYDVKEIAFLREYPCRVYYDLPDSMMKELRNIPSG